MSDYYTESQMQRIEQAAYDGATLEAGKEWERQRYEFDATEAKLVARIAELKAAQRDLREYIDELKAEKECEMRVFKDGNAWCFVLPDFQDLQVSSSVWMKEGVLDKIYKELRSVRNE